jgi:hypothetical protein
VVKAVSGGTAGLTLRRHWLVLSFAAFTCYTAIFAVLGGGEDRAWAVWASAGYALSTLLLAVAGRRAVWIAAGASLALALVAPLIWNSLEFVLEDGMKVIDRGAFLLLHHGSPYLPADQVTSWFSYNPYLPVMTLFGLPHAAGWPGLLGNAGVWLAIGSVIVIACAFLVELPRRLAWLAAAIAVASPVIALNLAVITTDPPVLGFMLLALALAGRRSVIGAGVALAVACVLKDMAWLAIPVLAALFYTRDGWRAAVRFVVALLAAAVVLIAALAPAAVIKPGPMIRDTVLFPLGLTKYTTPATSATPGHFLASMGHAGHAASVALLLLAGAFVAVSLFVWPVRTPRAAAWRMAIGLTLVFALGPDVRFGYFLYPLGLAGWVALTNPGLYTIIDRNDGDPETMGARDASSSGGQARRT